jgi:hypothetical protein
MCEGAAPLAFLTHKRTATCVRTAGAHCSYLLAFRAQRDRIVLRNLILLHLLGRCHFMPVHMLPLVHMLGLVHMLRPLCVGKSNRHGNCKQSHSEWLQHRFCTIWGGAHLLLAKPFRPLNAG